MIALMHIGVALCLALLFYILWRNPSSDKALVLDDEEISSHPNAIGFWMLDLGETVHCQTTGGIRFSFRVVDRLHGYFEVHGRFAAVAARRWIGAYVLGTTLGGKHYPRQFIPGGVIHFVATMERDGVEHEVDCTTDTIDRLFRTAYDGTEKDVV